MNASRLIQWAGGVPALNVFLRWCAAQYEEASIATIKSGIAAGFHWKRHHRYVNGYWAGHYELPLQEALRRELKPGDTFFDIGANAGFFTLVGARLVGPKGRCVAFDPSPHNAESICEQLELNGLSSYCICVQQAIGAHEGRAHFSFSGPGSPLGHLGEAKTDERQVEVSVTTLDHACAAYGAPQVIKLDIEGGEVDAFKSIDSTLTAIRPIWVIELHGLECERVVKQKLRDANYAFFTLRGEGLRPDQILPNHFVARPLQKGGTL